MSGLQELQQAEAARKKEEEELEKKRQAQHFAFLMTQTELYAHFMAGKLSGTAESTAEPVQATQVEASFHNEASSGAQSPEEPDGAAAGELSTDAAHSLKAAREQAAAAVQQTQVSLGPGAPVTNNPWILADPSRSLADPSRSLGYKQRPSFGTTHCRLFSLQLAMDQLGSELSPCALSVVTAAAPCSVSLVCFPNVLQGYSGEAVQKDYRAGVF